MLAGTRLGQFEVRAADDDRLAVFDEDLQSLLQRQRARLAIHQRQHLHAEGGLQSRVFVKLVQHLLGLCTALELDHDAHAALVRFIAQVGDLIDLVLAHQLRDALDQSWTC